MDRKLSSEDKRKDRMKTGLRIGIPVLAVAMAVTVISLALRPSVKEKYMEFAKAERGNIDFTVSSSGKAVPGYEEIINSPVTARIVEVFCISGEKVRKGEKLLGLDLESERIEYEKLLDQEKMKLLNIEQMKVSDRNKISEMEMNLEVSRMELEKLKSAVDNERYLDSIGAGTPEKVREAELSYKVALLKFGQSERLLENQKALSKADEAVKELDLAIFRKDKQQRRKRLDDAAIAAPIDATITFIENRIGTLVTEGSKVAVLSDLSWFNVDVSMSDRLAAKVSVGAKADIIVRNRKIPGTVTFVSPVSEDGTTHLTVTPADTTDGVLRSGLKCDVYVIYASNDDVIRIPRGSYYKGPGEGRLFVRDGDELVARKVVFGESNYDYVEVISGIDEGETVVISDMKDYDKMEIIRLK